MTLDEKIAAVEKKLRKINKEIKKEYHKNSKEFRKSRSHVLYEVGGEWFSFYSKTKITPGSDFDKIIEEEKEHMRKMYNSLPICPVCEIGRLIKEEGFWECDNFDCSAHVNVYDEKR